MKYKVLTKLGKDENCVAIGVDENKNLNAQKIFSKQQLKIINNAIKSGDISGKVGSNLLLIQFSNTSGEFKRVLILGLGDFNSKLDYTKIVKTSIDVLHNTKIKSVVFAFETSNIGQIAFEFGYQLYQYQQTLTKKTNKPALNQIHFFGTKQDQQSLKTILATIQGVNFARDLGNTPANLCTPNDLAKIAKKLAKDTIKVKVLSEPEIEKLKMGSFLSVSAGSNQPAKLIILEYQGHKTAKPFALVGKGVTFDTGGISLKPSSAMDEMKFDMCGAASVLGVFKALADLELPINVVGVIPATENLPNGRATKPGDVVTSMSGQTIEVLNTDAEGRLILCDALTYVGKYNPQTVIDIATLTGAVIVALGKDVAGLMANDTKLAQDLIEAGKSANDKVWQLPLSDYDESLKECLKSNFADMANIGVPGVAGSISAGYFLSKFTEDYKWAHLDIAGVAWKSGEEKGSTGRPVKLLLQYLINQAS